MRTTLVLSIGILYNLFPPALCAEESMNPSALHLRNPAFTAQTSEYLDLKPSKDVTLTRGYYLPKPSLIKLPDCNIISKAKSNDADCTFASDTRSYYALALPLAVDVNHNDHHIELDFAFSLTPAATDNRGFKIESIHPIHEYLQEQFKRVSTFTLDLQPKWFDSTAVDLKYELQNERDLTANFPTISGVYTNGGHDGKVSGPQVSWDLFKQGKQRIDVGLITNFVIFSVPKSTGFDAIQIIPGQTVQHWIKRRSNGTSVQAWTLTKKDDLMPLKTYGLLHSSELTPTAALLLSSFLMDDKKLSETK